MNNITEKKCTKCLTIKPISEFQKQSRCKDGHRYYCKKCMSNLMIKRYDDIDKKEYINNVRGWQKVNTRKRMIYHSKYHQKTREKECCRAAIRYLIRHPKSYSQRLGYSAQDLRNHLELQFRDGMTWENYSKIWHIDHIIPLMNFDGNNEKEMKLANDIKNLRPLLIQENINKGKKERKKYRREIL